jgi:hypothetical protein
MDTTVSCKCGHKHVLGLKYYKKVSKDPFYLYTCRACKSKEAWSDEERRRKSSELVKEAWVTNGVNLRRANSDQKKKEKIAKSAREAWDRDRDRRTASLQTNTARNRVGRWAKKKWEDPEYRLFQSARARSQWNDPVYRARGVAQGVACWKDPLFVAKQRAARSTEQFKARMAEINASQPRISSLQTMLYDLLDSLNVEYFREGPDTKIGPWNFDCAVRYKGGLLFIECQGEYWHSFPPSQARDKAKFSYIEKYFPQHEVMYLFEHEFHQKDRVLDRLKLKLGIEVSTEEFSPKDVVVGAAETAEVQAFLTSYHYIGKGRGGNSFGAFYNNKLIGVCVFSPPLRGNSKFIELSRLCIHPSFHKKNFASWFVSRCLRKITQDVIAFADTTVGHKGTVYKAANFKLSHEVPADYWYVDSSGWVMHKLTLYKRAVKMAMKEREYAEKHGFNKVWGGKKLAYVYKKSQ